MKEACSRGNAAENLPQDVSVSAQGHKVGRVAGRLAGDERR